MVAPQITNNKFRRGLNEALPVKSLEKIFIGNLSEKSGVLLK